MKKKKLWSQNRILWNTMFNFYPVRKGTTTTTLIVYQ